MRPDQADKIIQLLEEIKDRLPKQNPPPRTQAVLPRTVRNTNPRDFPF